MKTKFLITLFTTAICSSATFAADWYYNNSYTTNIGPYSTQAQCENARNSDVFSSTACFSGPGYDILPIFIPPFNPVLPPWPIIPLPPLPPIGCQLIDC